MTFFLDAAIRAPSLVMVPFQRPGIFVIVSALLAIALGFGIVVATLGALGGWRLPLAKRKAGFT